MGRSIPGKIDEGIAGADRPAQEIEVTPEMISAGVAALEFWREAALDELLVEEIYKAMRGRAAS